MKKIPTLFRRDPDDMKRVLPEVTPGCEWVLEGEGKATRKFDGTCVQIRVVGMTVTAMARREVKPGKTPPPGFTVEQYDENTGKTVGWEPAAQSPFSKFIDEAIDYYHEWGLDALTSGTYELCGPKINGNPEGFDGHRLIPHGDIRVAVPDYSFDGLRLAVLASDDEGIVWHHPDGRMAKLKRRDFPPV